MAKFSYDYPRPGITVDVINHYMDDNCKFFVLLIKRKGEPFKDCWALPGGYVNEGETCLDAAFRELKEETNLKPSWLDFFLLADKPGRDPRGWTITTVFYHDWLKNIPKVKAGDDAAEYQWFNVDELPELAFDHKDIILYMFGGKEKSYYDVA